MVNQSSINLNRAIDLLEQARVMTATNPHGAMALVHKAREIYPVSTETVYMIQLLAYPTDRNYALLMNLRARQIPHTPNKNKSHAAIVAWQQRKAQKE